MEAINQETTPSVENHSVQIDKEEPQITKNKSNTLLPIILLSLACIVLIGVSIFFFLGKSLLQNQTSPSSLSSQSSQSVNDEGTLKVAIIQDENGADANKKEFTPVVDYLVSHLSTAGITHGIVTVLKTPTEMATLVRQKKVDIVMDTAFTIYVVDKLANTTLIADRWKEGVEKYNSIFFAPKSLSIKSLDDLRGKTIAFDAPTSTTGYFLPKAFLIKKGYTLTEKKSFSDPVKPNEIGYVFVRPKSVWEVVASGEAPAGAESGQEVLDYFGKNIDQYNIFSQTPFVPRFLVAVRSDLNPSIITLIKQALFSMDTTEKGRTTLKNFSNTLKFTPLSANDTSYGAINDLVDEVDNEIVRQ